MFSARSKSDIGFERTLVNAEHCAEPSVERRGASARPGAYGRDCSLSPSVALARGVFRSGDKDSNPERPISIRSLDLLTHIDRPAGFILGLDKP